MKINLHNMRKCLFNTIDLRSYRKSEVWKLFKKKWKKFCFPALALFKKRKITKELKKRDSEVMLIFFRKLLNILIFYKGSKEECFRKVYVLMEQNLVSDAGRKLWCDLINYCYYGIVDEIRRCHSDLREEDIEFVCFIGVGFTVEELSFIYELSNKGSVYTKSYRIRKQMGLTCSLDIYIRKKIEYLKNSDKGTVLLSPFHLFNLSRKF